ncbi:DNA-formamidopyrimidine glycosylase [bacterium]|nr:DNA-formamidopyrimidine glycosylase [bacterium]
MPELPEVQTVVNEIIKQKLVGETIKDVEILVPALVAPMDKADFSQALKGRKITDLSRRAKYIVATLDNGTYFISHLRMSGHFVTIDAKEERGRFERARITFSNGKALRYDDIRKFGRFNLTKDKEEILGKLGAEPLEKSFTPKLLFDLLPKDKKIKLCIKAWLLDQSHVAGLGNIYVDEALWLAKIHPERPAASITMREAEALRDAIQSVLKKGIANSGTSLGHTQGNFISADGKHGNNAETLYVFHRQGKPCPRCGTTIIKTVVAQRGTHVCPNCQKK